MLDKYLENFLILFCFTFTISMLVFLCYTLPTAWADRQEHAKQRQAFITKYCDLAGYYGRSGEYKVYKCNGSIYKEEEL